MIKLCIAGKNNIAVNALHYVLKNHFSPNEVAVITNQNDTGLHTWQKSLKNVAKKLHVKEIALSESYGIKDLIFISLEFDKLIKIESFSTKKLFNIHFSNLPKYKGVFTSIFPILNGENTAGVSLHKIDSGIDTGEIIAQNLFKIDINDTARDLYFKYLESSYELFKQNIRNIITNNYTSHKQDSINSSYFSRKDLDLSNIKINLNKTSFEIHNNIRAFIFKEYQLPKLNDIKITKSILTNEFIGYKKFIESKTHFTLSGIDGYKILAQKLENL